MRKKSNQGNKKIIFIVACALLLVTVGVSYAFFTYVRIGDSNNKLIAGNIYLHYNESDTLTIPNAFPETKAEALDRDDNYITFTINGRNDNATRDINYEIYLAPGEEFADQNPLNVSDIVFRLTETVNNVENVIIDEASYADLNNRLIYTGTVLHNTTDEVQRTYKLRMWVNENVMISDTNPNATYDTSYYANSYISVRVDVKGSLSN